MLFFCVVAFKDLKRRFLNDQTEKAEFKIKYQKMSSDLQQSMTTIQQSTTTIHVLERKVEQLQKNLQSKMLAYNNLDLMFKQTRENEDSLIRHCEETGYLLEAEMKKAQMFLKDNKKLKNEQGELYISISELSDQKKQVFV